MKKEVLLIFLFITLGCKYQGKKCSLTNELDKVLTLYQEDSLRYHAASYLIENMNYHSYYEGEGMQNFLEYFELYSDGYYNQWQVKDSLDKKHGGFSYEKVKQQYDILSIDSAYMVQNIEWAFKVWNEQPWGKNISFTTFCKYILPYRIANEPLSIWREKIYNKYNPLLDSIRHLPEAEDPLFVAQTLLDSLGRDPIYFTEFFNNGPHIGPDVVDWRSGSCRELADLVIYVLRAVGIPCGMDYMIIRGDNNAPHFWNFVLDKNENTFYCEFPGTELKPANHLWNPKAKVYRRLYNYNSKLYPKKKKKPKDIHPMFNMPLFEDVTKDYLYEPETHLSFSSNLLYEKLNKDEVVYLCLSRRQEWLPIAWSYYENKDTIIFNYTEPNVVVRLATWKNEKLYFISDPILIKSPTHYRLFNSQEQKEEIKLLFKYHLYIETFIFRMPGGIFEGSNDPNFKIPDTLYTIPSPPIRLLNTIYLDNPKKYRYIRYVGPEGSFCNIAEFMLYENKEDRESLKGIPIGTPGCLQQDGSHEYINVFDGDPYTSFDYIYPSGGWAGLDLGKSTTISKLIYVPRNRDNFIRKGDEYELLYWKDKQWKSMGHQIARSDSLLFNVPKGALLYLKNHTRGKDERIFEYKNGEQRFW